MLDSPLFPTAAGIGLVFGGFCFLRSVRRWEVALKLLIIALCFGGIISVNLGSGAYAILFRDIFIVLPLFIGFFTSEDGQHALGYLPYDIVAILTLLLAIMFMSMLTSSVSSVGEIIIGLKVWLFYIPFIAVGVALAARQDALVRFFRTILLWGFAAAIVGLIQSLLVRLVGYEQVMNWFFGQNAIKVTQDFTMFDVAGGIYRIPGTFSFVAQYANFLYIFLVVAVIESHIEPNAQYKQIAQIGIFLATIAGVLSGAREAILSLPATLLVFAFGGLLSKRLLLLAPIGVAASVAIIALSGLNLVQYFFVGGDLASHYANDFIFQQLSGGLDYGVLGAGVGSSTSAARYASGLTINVGSINGFETYLGKAGAELGWLGLIVIALLMVAVTVRAIGTVLQNITQRSHVIVAPLAVFLMFIVISSLKGSPLDTDPGNIFFWLFLGVMVGVSRFGYQLDPMTVSPYGELYSEQDALATEEGTLPGE